MQENQQKILVVEDNPDIRSLVTKILSADGHHIFPATNGEDAIAILSANEIDMVLLDINLPGMSGLEVLSEIRTGSNKDYHEIPVIMISSRSGIEDIDQALEIGADSYLVKPFRGATVRDKVRTYGRSLLNA